MVLPAIIGAGLKIFQATRGKASSGSDVASNIVSKKTTESYHDSEFVSTVCPVKYNFFKIQNFPKFDENNDFIRKNQGKMTNFGKHTIFWNSYISGNTVQIQFVSTNSK